MKRFSEQFKKQSETIRLKAAERADLRTRLSAYMEYHPLPVSMREASVAAPQGMGLASQPYIALPVNWFYVRGVATAFALFVMVTVPVAAEYTTPGDVLYPVKVRFNEEVRSTLTLNPYAKIEWETKRLERRISEARLLASEGKLTDEIEAEVAVAVKEHSNSAQAQIAALRETDSDDAAIAEIAFATALSVQSEVLDKAIAMKQGGEVTTTIMGNEADATEGSVLASVVAEETSEATASQAATTPSFSKLMARIEVETTAAFELFTSIKDSASPEEVHDIERRLEDIKRKVAMANLPRQEAAHVEVEPVDAATATTAPETASATPETAAETEAAPETIDPASEAGADQAPVPTPPTEPTTIAEADAVEILRGAMADLRKLISFMTDIDVRQSVSVEELVPITLTEAERLTAVQTDLETVRAFVATYEGKNFSGAGAEKIMLGIHEVERLQAATEKALSNGQSIEAAEGSVKAARQWVDDLSSMISHFGTTSVTTPVATDDVVAETDSSPTPEE